jgi:hypothetical protein
MLKPRIKGYALLHSMRLRCCSRQFRLYWFRRSVKQASGSAINNSKINFIRGSVIAVFKAKTSGLIV